MPRRGYVNLSVRTEVREELEEFRARVGMRSLSEALEELLRRVKEYAPEILECRELEAVEDSAYVCKG